MSDRVDAMDGRLDAVCARLSEGEVVAVPTDTVYGLAVAVGVDGATDALFAMKQRPTRVALPVMVHDLEAACALVENDATGALRSIGAKFWPGALTVIARRDLSFRADLGGDRATVGLRVPDHVMLRELCRRCGPLGVSSANLHGEPPCTTAAEIRRTFGASLAVLDGGKCDGRVSTVVDLTGNEPAIVREGSVTLRDVLAALNG